MEILSIVTLLALLEYVAIFLLVGRARAKYGIKAPATSGHEIFDRYFRVQQNTLEQLVIFLPALWIFGWSLSYGVAALLGLVFIAGRALYLRGYVAAPEQRALGFGISALANLALVVGGLVGAALRLFAERATN
jgi:glutathione S-transferase